ncbi:MAG: SAM-dependent DNA methyltransferase [Deltaproteobacteria bacterium]|nr:SAM-dependent DNA methyltransferase [Deltaproteobacteria bacterium]
MRTGTPRREGSGVDGGRLALQAELDGRKSATERNRLGQFATPPGLAREVVRLGLAWLPPGPRVRFLDPAFGTGAFYEALRAQLEPPRIAWARGVERDAHYAGPAARLWRRSALELVQGDFTRRTAPTREAERANLLVCNPPYSRHHHLSAADKTRLRRRCEAASGMRLGGLAGLYGYFVGLADPWLRDGGVAVWLLPAEVCEVAWGAPLRRYLAERVTLLRLHRFRPDEEQFGDALVTSAVLAYRKEPPGAGHRVELTEGDSLARPSARLDASAEELARADKWPRLGQAPRSSVADHTPRLAELFEVRRGIATGDNRYFILEAERARALGLPPEVLRPILPGPRFLGELDEIAADATGAPLVTPRLVLLDCAWSLEEVRRRSRALYRYLEEGKARAASRYLCRHRRPWYAQEQRLPAPIVCTYMGRGAAVRHGERRPFRFLLNHSLATVPNVYLLLYPRPALAAELARRPGLGRELWSALRALDPQALQGEGRVYGGGLQKLEPRELGRVPVPSLVALLGRDFRPYASPSSGSG